MKIREKTVGAADQRGAKVFFDAVVASYEEQVRGRALEMFARDGQLTLSKYWRYPRELEIWELSEEHAKELGGFSRMRLGSGFASGNNYTTNLRIGCSYRSIQMLPVDMKFDFVSIDTPQGLHKDAEGNVHAEHFDALQLAAGHLNDGAVVALYCNKRPYDRAKEGSVGYDEYEEYDFQKWMRAREDFFDGWCDARDSFEAGMLDAYNRLIMGLGMYAEQTLLVPCPSDIPGREPYCFRLALKLRRL